MLDMIKNDPNEMQNVHNLLTNSYNILKFF